MTILRSLARLWRGEPRHQHRRLLDSGNATPRISSDSENATSWSDESDSSKEGNSGPSGGDGNPLENVSNCADNSHSKEDDSASSEDDGGASSEDDDSGSWEDDDGDSWEDDDSSSSGDGKTDCKTAVDLLSSDYPPCVCRPHQGCCCKHNSIRLAVPWTGKNLPRRSQKKYLANPDLPNTKSYVDGHAEILVDASETSRSLDHLSRYTLAPVHRHSQQHLSYDNIACVRLQLGSRDTRRKLISNLSGEDEASQGGNASYFNSLSEVYYDRGTFLQRQQMEWLAWPGDTSGDQTFFGCPHQSLSISQPVFSTGKTSLLEVQCTITNKPQRCPHHKSEKWTSSQGSYAQIVVCTKCHSDAECTIELLSDYLSVIYTCYRDLGPGTGIDRNWISLLTGEGAQNRSPDSLALYSRVFKLAYRLDRPNVEKVKHQTPKGTFEVNTSGL